MSIEKKPLVSKRTGTTKKAASAKSGVKIAVAKITQPRLGGYTPGGH